MIGGSYAQCPRYVLSILIGRNYPDLFRTYLKMPEQQRKHRLPDTAETHHDQVTVERRMFVICFHFSILKFFRLSCLRASPLLYSACFPFLDRTPGKQPET